MKTAKALGLPVPDKLARVGGRGHRVSDAVAVHESVVGVFETCRECLLVGLDRKSRRWVMPTQMTVRPEGANYQ